MKGREGTNTQVMKAQIFSECNFNVFMGEKLFISSIIIDFENKMKKIFGIQYWYNAEENAENKRRRKKNSS